MAGSKILSDEIVKAPNLIERAKEEIQAVIYSDRLHFHHKETDINERTPIDNVKAPNVFDRAKEEIEALIRTLHPQKDPKSHHKIDQSARSKEENEAIGNRNRETHGRRDNIDENAPIDEIRGPSIFQRAKEEVEALIGTIHRKKESSNCEVKEGGTFGGVVGRGLGKISSGEIGASIGRGLEKVCSPAKGRKTN